MYCGLERGGYAWPPGRKARAHAGFSSGRVQSGVFDQGRCRARWERLPAPMRNVSPTRRLHSCGWRREGAGPPIRCSGRWPRRKRPQRGRAESGVARAPGSEGHPVAALQQLRRGFRSIGVSAARPPLKAALTGPHGGRVCSGDTVVPPCRRSNIGELIRRVATSPRPPARSATSPRACVRRPSRHAHRAVRHGPPDVPSSPVFGRPAQRTRHPAQRAGCSASGTRTGLANVPRTIDGSYRPRTATMWGCHAEPSCWSPSPPCAGGARSRS